MSFNPTEDLGFINDKQVICSCRGFLTKNNSARDLCSRFIKNGAKFYDIISRYDDVTSYVLNREGVHAGRTMAMITPFLKAFGATDYMMYEQCKESLQLMPEAKRVMKYFMNVLPTFISTSAYEHNVMAVNDALDLPMGMTDYTKVSLDDTEFSRQDARALREYANTITNLRLPTHKYELNVPQTMQNDEIVMIKVLDDIFHEKLINTEAANMMRDMKTVESDSKAYAVLDIRKRTQIDLEGTAYIGGDMLDYQAMDLIKDSGGLSMSFNGSEFATYGSNIAVLSRDSTVAAVLVQEFYNEGIEAVYDLVNNWDKETLKKKDYPDRNLLDTMLANNSRKLPEVYIVDKKNNTAIAKKSDEYRKKLLLKDNH